MRHDEAHREQMFELIGSWQKSGLSQSAYCNEKGIRYHVFHYWYRRYRKQHSPGAPAGFVSLNVQPFSLPAGGSAAVELVLPDGKRLLFHQGVSAAYLKALIS
jgi:hypothetical protein